MINLLLLSLFFLRSVLGQRQSCATMTIRKEVNDLTEAEWNIYLDTIRESTKRIDPESGISIWETGIKHHAQYGSQTHFSGSFLYYHRQLLVWMEKKLQTINPAFAFFYWDSAREADSWMQSIVWKRLGKARKGLPIGGGPLAGTFLKQINGYLVRDWDFPNPGYNPPSSGIYNKLYADSLRNRTNVFETYTELLEAIHGAFHVIVGGDNGAMTYTNDAPADPLFWSHHAHIDEIFTRAQIGWAEAGVPHTRFIGGRMADGSEMRLTSPVPGFPSMTIGGLLDVNDLCIRYAPYGEKPPVPTTSSTASSTTISTSTSTVQTSSSSLLPTSSSAATTTSRSTSTRVPTSSSALASSTSTANAVTATSVSTSSSALTILTSSVASASSTTTSASASLPASRSTTGRPSPSTSKAVISSSLVPSSSIPASSTTSAYAQPTSDYKATTNMSNFGALAERWAKNVMGKEHAEKVRAKVDQVVVEVKESQRRGETITAPPTIPPKENRPYLGVDALSGAVNQVGSAFALALAVWPLLQLI